MLAIWVWKYQLKPTAAFSGANEFGTTAAQTGHKTINLESAQSSIGVTHPATIHLNIEPQDISTSDSYHSDMSHLSSLTYEYKDHFVYAPGQWEMTLHCKVTSRWLGAYTKCSLGIADKDRDYAKRTRPGVQRARASAALILTLVILGYSSLSTRYPGSEADPSQRLFLGNCLSNEFMGDLSEPQIN